ncbi:MAG: hypothetical protein RRA32_10875 [bacterium]|nr:hypothetical protein [bacterium]MDT8396924.1 hypothetical protein [bacterium]
MTRGSRKERPGGRWGRWVVPTVILLFLIVSAFLSLLAGHGGSPLDFSIKGFIREMLENRSLAREERSLLEKIGRLEKQHGADSVGELLNIGFRGDVPSRARREAFNALGRAGRDVDVKALLERSQ